MNSINLIGRITATPELKESKNTTYCRFSIAVDRMGQKGEADFFNCTAFGKTAEVLCEYVKKGNSIGISGSIETSKKENVTYYNVIVNRLTLVGGGKSSSSNDFEEEEPRKATPKKIATPKKPAADDDDDDYPF